LTIVDIAVAMVVVSRIGLDWIGVGFFVEVVGGKLLRIRLDEKIRLVRARGILLQGCGWRVGAGFGVTI